jgi:hypothetical protein
VLNGRTVDFGSPFRVLGVPRGVIEVVAALVFIGLAVAFIGGWIYVIGLTVWESAVERRVRGRANSGT